MLKKLYFSVDSIDGKSVEMIAALRNERHDARFVFSPRNSALLVLDMQSYFLDESSHAFVPSGRTIIPRINDLIEAYNELQRPIIFTRHVNTEENTGLMSVWWRETIVPENPMSQIVPEINTSHGMILEKSQYDAFCNTDLEHWLKEQDTSQVVISGVMTHLCCESTARTAFMRGFEVFFLVDGTATYNEKFHQASLINLAHGFAELKLVSEIKDAIHGSPPG
jgi:isochorismate hydrolase